MFKKILLKLKLYKLLIFFTRKKLIVSLTSHPKRINNLQDSLESLFKQTIQPNKIILWLAEEEFKNKEKDLPEYLFSLVNSSKLKIEWCKNLKPHKKYFYAFKKYPRNIITVDDDLVYEEDLIESLLYSYFNFPNAVSATRTHLMKSSDGKFEKYDNFEFEQNKYIQVPSMRLLATNGAGSLFSPSILKLEYLDEKLIEELCLLTDDLWLKTIEVLSNVPVVQTRRFKKLCYVPNSQDCALYKINKLPEGNDQSLENIRFWVDSKFGENYFISKIFNEQFESPNGDQAVLYFVPHQDDELLSMGVDIIQSVVNGIDVHVILCTDGSGSSIKKVLGNGKECPKHTGKHVYNLSDEQFIKARDREFIESCCALGVKSINIHIDQNRAKDGNLGIEHAKNIVQFYLGKFPKNVTVATIYHSNGEKQHKDHKNLGYAINELFKEKKIKNVRFFREPYCNWKIRAKKIFANSHDAKVKIDKATEAYSVWKPEEECYAIGYHSVTNEFEELKKKMVNFYFEIKNY